MKTSNNNNNTGWIKLHRSIEEHWIFQKDRWFKWWVLLLIEANHSSNKITLGYKIYNIEKGQSAKSLRTWAELFGCNIKTVIRFFNLLEKDGMVTRKVVGKGVQSTTLINIENYSQYQSANGTLSTTQEGTQRERKGVTNKNVKNVKNINIPTYSEFKEHAISKNDHTDFSLLKLKFDSWVENGWRNGLNKPIKNWRSTLTNTLPHLRKKKIYTDRL